MSGLHCAIAAAALVLAPLAAAGGDPDPIELTSSTRSITLSTWIDDGVAPDGDFFMDSSNTLADWQASHSLSTELSGGTADCTASHDSSTTPDGFTVAITCTAGSSNPGSLPESQASAISSFQLEFTVVETTVFAVDASLQSEFISFDAYSQPSYQLEEVSGCDIGENCLIMDFFLLPQSDTVSLRLRRVHPRRRHAARRDARGGLHPRRVLGVHGLRNVPGPARRW
ncbi:MAG: hypothetical protein ACYS0D_01325 [Planctomycetota bacterium]|jgi:hypothetical protein